MTATIITIFHSDKKAACYSLGGYLKSEERDTLLECEIECCNSSRCNTKNSSLTQDAVTVFTPEGIILNIFKLSLISWVNPFPSRFINRTACFPRKVSYFRESRMSPWKKWSWMKSNSEARPSTVFLFYYTSIFTVLQPLGSGMK